MNRVRLPGMRTKGAASYRLRKPVESFIDKEYFTSGEVAMLCGCAPRTVTKWCDRGLLHHYCMPESNDRRIKRDDLYSFMRRQKMDVGLLDRLYTFRLLTVGFGLHGSERLQSQLGLALRREVGLHQASSIMEIGISVVRQGIHGLLIDLHEFGRSTTAREIKVLRSQPDFDDVHFFPIVAIGADDETEESAKTLEEEFGFSKVLLGPAGVSQLADTFKSLVTKETVQ